MLERNERAEIDGLIFEHMEFEDGCSNIYVEDPETNNTASLTCALTGVFSNNDTPLTKKQMETCEEVFDWASKEGLY